MATLISEIFAFLVMLFVLYRYVWPLVKNMVSARQDVVQQQVDDSAEADRLLREAQERFDKAVNEAETEAARIRDDARADSTRIREELTEQAEREVERIKQRGVEQLAAQRDQVVRRLRAELGGLSMQLAERVVVESLSDERRRSATVDRFLADLDGMSGAPDSAVTSGAAAPAGGGTT